MAASAVAPTVVIGIGNPMRRDDGVGPAVIGELRARDASGTITSTDPELLVLDGESTRLLEAWRNRRRAIVVDAASSGAPAGTVTRIDVGGEDLPATRPAASSHSTGLAEAVELARALDALPPTLVVYGVEAHDVGYGEGLSDGVRDAVPGLLDRILDELAEPGP